MILNGKKGLLIVRKCNVVKKILMCNIVVFKCVKYDTNSYC